ncbi:MAG TPA: cytochrome P450 [Nocardioides sp.]|nr:cytochrome P450 [Nocardioides sp.]
MPLLEAVKGAVRRRLVARAGGIDLTQLHRVPDRLSWPLDRQLADPVPRVTAMREKDPVSKLITFLGMDIWLVTGDAEAREVLGDLTSYSTDIRPYYGKSGAAGGDIGGLGFTDPPEHTRLRKLLTPEFTMRRLARLKPAIDRIIDGQLDETERVAAANDGVVDLVKTFAFPIPFLVICELLGLRQEDRETFRKLGSARFDVTTGGGAIMGAVGASREFLFAECERQRTDPGPGLIGQIIREHGDEISDFDLGGLADGAFTGGLETSASMLALGTVVLLGRPDLYAGMAADPATVISTVEELLRHLSVVQVAFPRFTKADVEVGGHRIRKGSCVMVHLPASDRDPRTYPAGDALDPSRATSSHLAFGYGFHRCVGAELARMELRAAYPALARRFPDLALTVPAEELGYHAKSIVYGVESVPVRLHG